MFWWRIAPSSWESSSHLGMLDSWTTANHSPSDAESFPEDLNLQNAVKGHHQSWNAANFILLLLCTVLTTIYICQHKHTIQVTPNMNPRACFSDKSPFLITVICHWILLCVSVGKYKWPKHSSWTSWLHRASIIFNTLITIIIIGQW
jgi:hypothetical protein